MAGRVFEDVVEPEEEDVIEAAASFVVKVEPPKSSDVRMGGRPEPIVEMFSREAGEETGMAKGFEVFTSSIILFMLLDDKTKADDVSNNKMNKLKIYTRAYVRSVAPSPLVHNDVILPRFLLPLIPQKLKLRNIPPPTNLLIPRILYHNDVLLIEFKPCR